MDSIIESPGQAVDWELEGRTDRGRRMAVTRESVKVSKDNLRLFFI